MSAIATEFESNDVKPSDSKCSLKHWFPILQWLPGYRWAYFKRDLLAGITVSILGVPQCLAYAILAGLPPEWGLYASVIPIAMYVIWGTSTQIALGTVATTAIMIASATENVLINAGVHEHDPGYQELYQSIVITLSFVCGIVRIVFGLLRCGFISNFLSRPVMTGFIMSVAYIILINQFRGLFGLDIDRYPLFYQTLVAVCTNIQTINWYCAGISAISLALLFLPKCMPSLPRWTPMPLIVIVLWSFISYLTDLEALGVSIIGNEIKPGLPSLKAPNFNYIFDVWHGAVIIAVVSYMGSIALAKEFEQKVNETYKQELSAYNEWQKKNNHTLRQASSQIPLMATSPMSPTEPGDANVAINIQQNEENMKPPQKPLELASIAVDPNMEFIAYGFANMLGCFFSGMIVSGSFSRSALKYEMNACTQVASGVQAFICFLCLVFLMPLLAPLPKCVLAAVVAISVYRLIKNGILEFKFLLKVSKIELIEYGVAAISPLIVGLELGILVSVFSSIIVNLLRHSFATISFLHSLPSPFTDNATFVDAEAYENAHGIEQIVIIEMNAELGFTNNNRLTDRIKELLAKDYKYIVVSLNLSSFIDTTAIRQIVTIFEDAKSAQLAFSHCRPRARALIDRYQDEVKEFPDNIKLFVSTHDAVYYLEQIRDYCVKNESGDEAAKNIKSPVSPETDKLNGAETSDDESDDTN